MTLRLLNPNTVQQPTPGKHILFYSGKNFWGKVIYPTL